MGAALVWGRDDLTCPVSHGRIQALLRHAADHPWPGNAPLTCRGHCLDTTAITEPGRLTRVMVSRDYGYHQSGWFANADYETCLHLSMSHPVPEQKLWYPGRSSQPGVEGMNIEAPSDDEVRAWGRVFYRQHAPLAWFEPAVGPGDDYRIQNIAHLRLYLDGNGQPFIPKGEVYHLRPFADGSSPAKITEGRAGGDVR
jgi:hypothetical protein